MMELSKPNITEAEVEAVTAVLRSGGLSDGVTTTKFEHLFQEMFGYDYVVAVNSGTTALYLSLLAHGIGHGDEVLVTPYTFVASVNVVLAVGATPVFVDIDPQTYNMDPQQVAQHVTHRTKAIIPVDVFGEPCDILKIMEAIPHNVVVVQDSVEAIGSRYQGQPVGCFADVACFGFYPNKQITTAEGGVVVTSSKSTAETVRRLAHHGVIAGDTTYKHWGHNFRLSDVHAAIGIVQLQRFHQISGALKQAHNQNDTLFKARRVQQLHESVTPFVYVIALPGAVSKQAFIDAMRGRGIMVKPYFNSLLEQPHLRQYDHGQCPVAAQVGAHTVALPMHHELTRADVADVHRAYTSTIQACIASDLLGHCNL